MRQVGVRHRRRASAKLSANSPRPEPEHDRHARHLARRTHANRASRLVLLLSSTSIKDIRLRRTRAMRTHSRKPAIVAVMKFASVPASIARKPSRARS